MSAAALDAMPLRLPSVTRWTVREAGDAVAFGRSATEAVGIASKRAKEPYSGLVTVTTRDPDSGVTREIWSSQR